MRINPSVRAVKPTQIYGDLLNSEIRSTQRQNHQTHKYEITTTTTKSMPNTASIDVHDQAKEVLSRCDTLVRRIDESASTPSTSHRSWYSRTFRRKPTAGNTPELHRLRSSVDMLSSTLQSAMNVAHGTLAPPYSTSDKSHQIPHPPQRQYRARLLCHFDGQQKADSDKGGTPMKVTFTPFVGEDVYPLTSPIPTQKLELGFQGWAEPDMSEVKREFVTRIGDMNAFKHANMNPDCFLLVCRNRILTKDSPEHIYTSRRLSLLMLPIYAAEYNTLGYDYAGADGDLITVEADDLTWEMPEKYRKN